MKRILIIEDNERILRALVRALTRRDDVMVCQAETLPEAEAVFADYHTQLDAIAIDGCVPGNDYNAHWLIEKFRESYSGPIIAIAGAEIIRKAMLRDGCSHECEKIRLPAFLDKLLSGK